MRPGTHLLTLSPHATDPTRDTTSLPTSSRSTVRGAGGRFLEAPVSGSKKPAIDGQLIILSAGDRSLYDEVLPAFDVMGKRRFARERGGAAAGRRSEARMPASPERQLDSTVCRGQQPRSLQSKAPVACG